MDLILKYFPQLSETQKAQLSQLNELYRFWNSQINLISRKDIDNLYLHHILHSLSLVKVISFKDGANVMDVGTGGGFPGIPLAIMFPEVQFYLVDSIGKKIKVVKEVSAAIGLRNVSAEQTRVELIKDKFDFIVSRAVTTLPEFHGWIQGKVKKAKQHNVPNGLFYLKGGDLTEEIEPFKKKASVFSISDFFKEDYFETKKIIYLPLA
ncbi:MAG TPA: 16S rRNA (guanine(527)-N(7))-methyltransferase RsmG [Bacteroidales bacterium]|nr:16S rRNA (guanine(527)-N(7))-methyltransferase RsmG [Bacteroidales bacterium]